MRIAVFVSGNGTNLQAIIDAVTKKQLAVDIAGVICNKPDAFSLERAKRAGIDGICISGSRQDFEKKALDKLDNWQVDCLVLAGFMRILSADFIQQFTGIILNIHPSLLPRYKGLNTHQRVLNTGDQIHGCSVHLVNEQLDSGPVIAQSALLTHHDDTADGLTKRVQKLEHGLLPRVIGWIADGRVSFDDQKLKIDQIPHTKPPCFFYHDL